MEQSRLLWLVSVPIGLVLILLAGGMSFLVGRELGVLVRPSSTPVPTRPFPAWSTSTPTPTSTVTPRPTGTPTPTSTSTPTPTPTPTPRVIITEVQALGRLETSRYILQTVIDRRRAPSNIWEQFFGADKLLLVAEGEVVAGFDLTKVKRSDIVVRGDHVIVVLPPPEILYSKVDNEKTYVYERKTGLFVRPSPDLESEARRLAEEAMVKRALEGGILQQAEANGRLQIEAFLRSLGFTDVLIVVRSSP